MTSPSAHNSLTIVSPNNCFITTSPDIISRQYGTKMVPPRPSDRYKIPMFDTFSLSWSFVGFVPSRDFRRQNSAFFPKIKLLENYISFGNKIVWCQHTHKCCDIINFTCAAWGLYYQTLRISFYRKGENLRSAVSLTNFFHKLKRKLPYSN